jgi:DNA-binding MarR family transcriptional regulator
LPKTSLSFRPEYAQDDLPFSGALSEHIDAAGTRLTDLAARAQITKQSMGYLVDYLERRGYVERRPDTGDRRATVICLTDRGWDETREALRIIAELEAEWAAALGEARMHQLRDLLAELKHHVAR